MVEQISTRELLLKLCNRFNGSQGLSRSANKQCFELFGVLLKLTPTNITKKKKLQFAGQPINSLIAETSSMRCARKFDEADRLNSITNKILDAQIEASSLNAQSDFESCLEFLLHLPDWNEKANDITNGQWRIPQILMNETDLKHTDGPHLYGDSNIYRASFFYTEYPNDLFEKDFSLEKNGESFSFLNKFEMLPEFTMSENSRNHFSLFGAVRKPYANYFGQNISLNLPILTDKAALNPFENTLNPLLCFEQLKVINKPHTISLSMRKTPDEDEKDPTAFWNEVCKPTMVNKKYISWETRTGPPSSKKSEYFLCQAGPKVFDSVYHRFLNIMRVMFGSSLSNVSENEVLQISKFVKDVINLLLSIPSETFPYNQKIRRFVLKSDTRLSGTTPEAIYNLMEVFLDCGSIYTRLDTFSITSPFCSAQNSGFVVHSFKEGIRDYLQHYRGFILHLAEVSSETLLSLHQGILSIYRQLRYLKELCAGEHVIGLRTVLPKGLNLVNFLFEQTIQEWGGENMHSLLSLLKFVLTPYFNFLCDWLFKGRFYDPHSEFDIKINENYLSNRFDDKYWSCGYTVRENKHRTHILQESLSEAILICGKSLSLLKICCPKHCLFDVRHEQFPELALLLSEEEFSKMKIKSQRYYETYLNFLDKSKEEKLNAKLELQRKREELILDKKNRHKEKIAASKILVKPKVSNETSSIPNYLQTRRDKKNLENSTPDYQEDKEFIAVERLLKKDLIEHYSRLEKNVGQEIKSFEWQTKRLALNSRRSDFLKSEKEEEMSESLLRESVTVSQSSDNFDKPIEKSTSLIHLPEQAGFDKTARTSNNRERIRKSFSGDFMFLDTFQKTELSRICDSGFGSEIGKSSNFDSPTETKSITSIEEKIEELQEPALKDNDISVDLRTQDTISIKSIISASDVKLQENEFDLTEVASKSDCSKSNCNSENTDVSSTIEKNVPDRFSQTNKFCAKPYITDYPEFDSSPMNDIFSALKSCPDSDVKDTSESFPTYQLTPLPVLIHQSLNPPILAQIRLVNRATLDYFMEELNLQEHFVALRNYFFFYDGEFGHILSKLLFEKISLSVSSIISPFDLMGILDSALSSSISVLSERHSFSSRLSFMAEGLPTKGFASTEFLHLKYKTPWPVNLIITDSNLEDYDKIFGLLLEIKQALWVLNDTWHRLKKTDRKLKGQSRASEFRKTQIFRHEMLHFVENIQSHLCCQLLRISWTEFENNLQNGVQNLEDLRNIHHAYIQSALKRCILSPEDAPILKLVRRAFKDILKFRNVVVSFQWQEIVSQDQEAFFKIEAAYLSFKRSSQLLYNAMKMSLNYRKQKEVRDFLVSFDFNHFYERQK